MNLKRITSNQVVLGEQISQSIYSEQGDLLLRAGKTITTRHQVQALLKRGFVMPMERPVAAPVLAANHVSKPRGKSIFDHKEQWLGELYNLLIRSQEKPVSQFAHRILQMALDIQLQAEQQHDAWSPLCNWISTAIMALFTPCTARSIVN